MFIQHIDYITQTLETNTAKKQIYDRLFVFYTQTLFYELTDGVIS